MKCISDYVMCMSLLCEVENTLLVPYVIKKSADIVLVNDF